MRQQFEQAMPISEKAAVLSRGKLIARPRKLNFHACDYCCRRMTEDNDAIAEIDRFFKIMGDEDGNYPLFSCELKDFVLQRLAGHRVEGAERFVHQQELRLLGKATCDLHSLLHAPRELPRKLFLCLA